MGPGGSAKRRAIVKEYKQGRKPIRLNRESNLTPDEETENKVWQQTRLLEYLNELPIPQFMFPEVEADDVIAYIVQSEKFKGWQKVIVSSDKDFIQLCDDETVLFRPIQKEVLTTKNVLENLRHSSMQLCDGTCHCRRQIGQPQRNWRRRLADREKKITIFI